MKNILVSYRLHIMRLPQTTQPATEQLSSKAEVMAWCSAFAMEAAFIDVGNLLIIVLFRI